MRFEFENNTTMLHNIITTFQAVAMLYKPKDIQLMVTGGLNNSDTMVLKRQSNKDCIKMH